VIGAMAVFFVVLIIMALIGSTYDLLTGPYGFGSSSLFKNYYDQQTIWDGVLHEAIDLWLRVKQGGLSIALSSLVIPTLYLWFAGDIKSNALFNTDWRWAIGPRDNDLEGVNIYVVLIALAATIVYVCLMPDEFNRFAPWWHVPIAGALAATLVQEALERVADAANIGKSQDKTIARVYGPDRTVSRRYLT
jgi:hypothetical protein